MDTCVKTDVFPPYIPPGADVVLAAVLAEAHPLLRPLIRSADRGQERLLWRERTRREARGARFLAEAAAGVEPGTAWQLACASRPTRALMRLADRGCRR